MRHANRARRGALPALLSRETRVALLDSAAGDECRTIRTWTTQRTDSLVWARGRLMAVNREPWAGDVVGTDGTILNARLMNGRRDMTCVVEVDTTQLDDALRKVDLLLQKEQQLQQLQRHSGVSGAAVLAGAAVAVVAPKRFTRRALLRVGLGRS